MTNIYLRESNGQKEIICKGHSGYAVAGQDIVCSAVSILTYSFNRLAIEMDKRNKLQLNILKISDGEVHTLVSDPANLIATSFFMLRMGLESLQENYPENVKIYLEWEDFLKASMQ